MDSESYTDDDFINEMYTFKPIETSQKSQPSILTYFGYNFICKYDPTYDVIDKTIFLLTYNPTKKYSHHNPILNIWINYNVQKFLKYVNTMGFFILMSWSGDSHRYSNITIRTHTEETTKTLIRQFLRNTTLRKYVTLVVERSSKTNPFINYYDTK